MKPYENNLEYLLDELSRIDLLVRSYLESFREDLPEVEDDFRGLYISEAEIEQIQRGSGFGRQIGILPELRIEKLIEINIIRKEIDAKKVESLKKGHKFRLHMLCELFNLDQYERDIILIGLAPELDLKYEKLYSYLQNDVTKKRPAVDLALSILFPLFEEKIKSRVYFSPSSSLLRNHLIDLMEAETSGGLSLLSSFIKIDERIINFLLGFDELDSKIKDFSYIIMPEKYFGDLFFPEDFKSKLINSVHWHSENNFPLKLLFCGPAGCGKKSAAEAICEQAGINLLIVDSKILLEGKSLETANLIMREALLQNAALYLQSFDLLLEEKDTKSSLEFLISSFKTFPGWIILAGKESIKFDISLINNGFVPYIFSLPSYSVRIELWKSCLMDHRLSDDVDLNVLASKFRFSGGQIKGAALTACNLAGENNPSCLELSAENLYESCKAHSNQKLSSLALKTNLHYKWRDIILPNDTLEHLKEISSFIKHKGKVHSDWGFEKKLSLGKGLNILFSGPSGTGKTMAAEILANEVRLDLYKIDLSSLVSKYIGETEKNLKKIFDEAETSNSILFFDEADALFGKRSEVKDSHDRYANIETAYLLQKMEEHEGIVILASNFRNNIDEAFLRRMHFVIEFPLPDCELRERIWRNIFPKEMPIDDEIDFGFLSKLKITGGNIKNIALNAAFLAASDSSNVKMNHIIRATKREFQKMGKLCTAGDFGTYYELVK